MRVAMLGWEFPPFKTGGLAVHAFHLTRELANLGASIDFFMPSATPGQTPPSAPWMRVVPVPLKHVQRVQWGAYSASVARAPIPFSGGFFDAVRAYNEALVDAVAAEHGRRPYDVVHGHDWLTAEAGLALRAKLGVPFAWTVHSTEFDRTAGFPWDWILAVERRAARGADAVICVSQRTRDAVVSQLGAPAEKTRVVYNGVDAGPYAGAAGGTARRDEGAESAGMDGREYVVLFHGRLTAQKGPEYFLQAAQRVLRAEPRARFVVSGKGDLLPKLIELAIDLGISDRVTFTGFVGDDLLRRLYASSDVYVLPSVSEPFGITVLEALASGTPAIVSRTAGVEEVVRHVLRVDFWDVDDLANKILAVLHYRELHDELHDRARGQVQPLTWARAARETLNAYEAVHRANARPEVGARA